MSQPPPAERAGTAPALSQAGYTTQISTARGSEASWTAGLKLVLIAKQRHSKAAALPTLEVHLGGEDVTTWASSSVINDQLQVAVDLASSAEVACQTSPGLYLVCSALFRHDGRSFTGTVAATCADRSGTTPYHWKGTADDTTAPLLDTPESPWPALLHAARPPQGGSPRGGQP